MIVRQPIITAFVYTSLMWSYISLFLYCPSVSYATNIFFSFKIIHRYRYISSQDGQSRRGNVFKKGNVIECSFILFRWHFHRVTRITSDFLQGWILSTFCLFFKDETQWMKAYFFILGVKGRKKSLIAFVMLCRNGKGYLAESFSRGW